MKASILKRIGLIALAVFIVAYFSVMLYRGNINTGSMIDTEIASKYSYNENITASGFIARNETLLTYDGSKVLYYTVSDGDIVGVGAEVALVFANETDALNYKKVNEINKEIEVLQSLNTSHGNANTDFSAVDKQIELNLTNIISAVNSNSASSIASSGDSLIYSINQRQIVTGEVKNFNEKIASLNAEAEKYRQAGSDYIDVITTDTSGYFVASADGYENVLDYETVPTLTVDEFSKERKPAAVSDNTIGKIVSGLNWYVVCELSADDALTLSHSNVDITLSFPNTTCSDIPATLIALNQASKSTEGVAVFKCNYMNTPLSHLRNETIQITVNSFTGIRVSKEALHDDYVDVQNSSNPNGEQKKVQGVYTVRGSELVFKEISILYAGKDFVIADDSPEEGVLISGETIELNDEIVVRGEDLYNGKIIK